VGIPLDGHRVVNLTNTGVTASVFRQEKTDGDARSFIKQHPDEPFTLVAFSYDGKGIKHHLIFLGTNEDCAEWFSDNYRDFYAEYQSVHEATRVCEPIKLVFDVDLAEGISLTNDTEALAARIKDVREAVIGVIFKHILVPLLCKDYDYQAGLRIYQCHRPSQREIKDYDGKKVVDAVNGEVQMEPYYKISYHTTA